MAPLAQDLRYALRGIRRSPLLASIAVLSLALGIGANTAIFTIMDQLMLRPLPVTNPASLVMLYQMGTNNGNNNGYRVNSYPIYRDFQQKSPALAQVLCRRLTSGSLTAGNNTERVDIELVSGNYFSMLGVTPTIGRLFNSREDDRVYNGHPVAVLSYDYWTSRFNRDPSVVGRKIFVNNYPMTIIGVSARGFFGFDPARAPQIRVPILMKPTVAPYWSHLGMEDRRSRWVQVFARLKPGYTMKSAEASLQVLFHQIREFEATEPAAKDWSAYERREFLRGTIHLARAEAGYSDLRRNFSSALVVLMSMVGLVLLIACANVANLLIARAFARRKEIAVRLSMGATRGRLVCQLLVESMVLSIAGGAAGICISIFLTHALLALMPAESSPLLVHSSPDLRILSFTAALTLATSLIFGLLPAIGASRPNIWVTLKDAAGSIAGSGGALFFRKGLVIAQVALSFVLLFGAGLFAVSLGKLLGAKTGFHDPGTLVTFQVAPDLSGYDLPRGVVFYRNLLDALRGSPGVRSAGLASDPLLAGDEWDSTTQVEGHVAGDGEDMQAFMNAISPGYFDTMGIPLLAGRDFDRRDVRDKSNVAIVNESFARHFFAGRSALGRHLGQGRPGSKLEMEIVGVVGDSLFEGPREGVHRQVFIPHYDNSDAAIYVRGGMDRNTIYAAIQRDLRGLDPAMPFYQLKTLEMQLNETLLSERLIAYLSFGFGVLATLLASIGLYGVMAFVVARRTKEVGIRMALGAQRRSVVWLVMKEVALLVAIGLAIGVPAAAGLGRFAAAQLFGVSAFSPWIAGMGIVILAVAAALAGLIPARRASRIDPTLALRYE
jgi:predicted permease